MEGDRIIKAEPKSPQSINSYREPVLVFSAIFVAEPDIFSYTGPWIETDMLPILAEKSLLYGYFSSEGEFHVHSKEDAKLAQELMLDRPT